MSDAIDQKTRESLILSAREASERAYCPYSNFPVGAALLGVDGEIYIGCNVENVSYGLSICAERSAVFNAVVNGCRKFLALALAAGRVEPATPCGACRQVLAEFCDAATPVFYADLMDGGSHETTIGDLLPLAFTEI